LSFLFDGKITNKSNDLKIGKCPSPDSNGNPFYCLKELLLEHLILIGNKKIAMDSRK